MGCVSCHTVDKARCRSPLSVALKSGRWEDRCRPACEVQGERAGRCDAQGQAPAPRIARGHPGACLDCHDSGSKKAPPFSQLLHLAHLTARTTRSSRRSRRLYALPQARRQDGAWSMPSGRSSSSDGRSIGARAWRTPRPSNRRRQDGQCLGLAEQVGPADRRHDQRVGNPPKPARGAFGECAPVAACSGT